MTSYQYIFEWNHWSMAVLLKSWKDFDVSLLQLLSLTWVIWQSQQLDEHKKFLGSFFLRYFASFFCYLKKNLYFWLCLVLVAACGIFTALVVACGLSCPVVCGLSVPGSGVELNPLAYIQKWILSHCTTREIHFCYFLMQNFIEI